ncbi:MAG: Nif3-like dinuclear metal center hexameric protein [Candidatus Margulisiibacteriota bacterium]|jgi:dinuclear metal center YbgI/SA1388 family protein
MTKTKLKNIINLLESWAPLSLAESFDNSGLQIGNLDQDIRNILLAVDLDKIAMELLENQKYDLIITHHPLFFKPISSINTAKNPGKIIANLIKKNIALYAMHTNLDFIDNGVNDALITAYGFDPALGKLIRPKPIAAWCKMIVYLPEENLTEFQEKIFTQFPSQIGNYDCCSFSTKGSGFFKPLTGAKPYIGKINQLEKVPEIKFEFLIKKHEIQNCIDYVRKIHPYEEPAFDIFEEQFSFKKIGVAKYFKNTKKTDLHTLISKFKCIVISKIETPIELIAFAPGNASYLAQDFINHKIDLIITGEIGYHEKILLELNNINVIELGHKESEAFVLPNIKSFIIEKYPNLEINFPN